MILGQVQVDLKAMNADMREREKRTMKRTRHHEAFELLQQDEQVRPLLITEAHLLGLPELVQRYLRYAQVVGKESIRVIRLKQTGFMRLQPGQKWLPMVAEQYFTTNPPAYLWHSTIKPFPLLSMSGTDWFSGDHAVMAICLYNSSLSSHWPTRMAQKLIRGRCYATCLR